MEKCEWELIFDDDEEHYESECGGEWFFFQGTRQENQMKLCPFCGNSIQEWESIA